MHRVVIHNRQNALIAVKFNGLELGDVVPSLRDDVELVLAAVRNNPRALRYASHALQCTRGVVLATLASGYAWLPPYEEICGQDVLRLPPAYLRSATREAVLRKVTRNGMTLKFAEESFRNDPEIVLRAVAEDGAAFQYASADLRKDRAFVLSAVSANGWALRHAPFVYQCDREVVHRAVARTALALWFASPVLRADHDLITLAVDGDRRALLLVRPQRRARYARAGPVETRLLFRHMPASFHIPEEIVEQYILPRVHGD